MVITLKPISRRASPSRIMRPSNTNAGFFIVSYTARQSMSWNSFHSVATTTASLFCAAESAVLAIVTCFLTEKKEDACQAECGIALGEGSLLCSRGTSGRASERSYQIWDSSTWGSYIVTRARSERKSRTSVMAGDSRVSPVSALNAKPRTAMFYQGLINIRGYCKREGLTLLVIVLKRVSTTRFEKRRFWYSFRVTTWRQYAATSGR